MSSVKHWKLKSSVSSSSYGQNLVFESRVGGVVLDSTHCQLFELNTKTNNLIAFNDGKIYINKTSSNWVLIGVVDTNFLLSHTIVHVTNVVILADDIKNVFLCISKNNNVINQYWTHINNSGCTIMKDNFHLKDINVSSCRSVSNGSHEIYFTFESNMKNIFMVYDLNNNNLNKYELNIKNITLENHGFVYLKKNNFLLFKNSSVYFLHYDKNGITIKCHTIFVPVIVSSFWYVKVGSMVYVLGGIESISGHATKVIQYFDLTTKTVGISRMKFPRVMFSYSGGACVDSNGYIHVAGGSGSGNEHHEQFTINPNYITERYIKLYLNKLPKDLMLLIVKYIACRKCVDFVY